MLLFFVVFIFFILHIQFLLRNIIWGVEGSGYFSFYVPYLFSRDVAVETLLFSVSCLLAFVSGFVIIRTRSKKRRVLDRPFVNHPSRATADRRSKAILILIALCGLQICLEVYVLLSAGLSYWAIIAMKESMSFLFETRMLMFLLVGYLYLNVAPRRWVSTKRLKTVAVLLATYLILAVLMQARSVVFEFATVMGFAWLMWQGDSIKVKYVLGVIFAMLVPNLMVLLRLGDGVDPMTLLEGVFSFEYSVLFNNLVSAAIASNQPLLFGSTFVSSLLLLVPSPVRAVLGLEVIKSDSYSDLSAAAGVGGGGFSMVAEMYMNFGWGSIGIFILLGLLIGKVARGASRVGRVGMSYAVAPLMYAAFILSFRNDFGVFVKYAIQLVVAAALLKLLLRIKSAGRRHVVV